MPGTITNPRTFGEMAVGFAWQPAFGTPATPTDVLWVQEADINPQLEKLSIEGTTGTQFKLDCGRKIVAQEPVATLVMCPTSDNAPPFLTSGTNRSFVNDADLTETGDNLAQLSNWALEDVRPEFNTDDDNKIYVDVVSAGQVDLFSDAARTQLVGQITTTGVGVAINEQNNSGLTGTVDFAFSGADNDIVLTINTIRFGWRPSIRHYFTLGIETGFEMFQIEDAWVTAVRFESAERSALRMTVEIAGKTFSIQPSTIAPEVPDDCDCFVHKDLTFSDGTTNFKIRNLTIGFQNAFDPFIANQAAPTLIQIGNTTVNGSIRSRFSDEMRTILNRALAETRVDITSTWVFGTRNFVMGINNPSFGANPPGFRGGQIDEFEAPFEAFISDEDEVPLSFALDL